MTRPISRKLLKFTAAASVLALVAGCNAESDEATAPTETAASPETTDYGYETYSEDNLADTMASNDDASSYGSSSNGSAANSSTPAMNPQMQPASDNSGSSQGASGSTKPTPASTSTSSNSSAANKNAGTADKSSGTDIPDSQDRPMMQLQVVLDRRGFGPGVIDGKMGMSTENALMGFQEANGFDVTGKHGKATKDALSQWDSISATRIVTIPESWAEETYTDIPEETAQKAELDRMGYKSLDEKLAERFHTTIAVLKQLNPNGRPAGSSGSGDGDGSQKPSAQNGNSDSFFAPGQRIRVPNIGGDRIAKGAVDDMNWQRTLASLGVGTDQPEVDRIVVSKSENTLKAYQGDKLVGLFTVSSGSAEFPLPIGEWDILAEAYLPPYTYDPEVLGQGEGESYTLPPGPNSPVGIVWIDLSKEHYGIHGTPEPETIGRAQSSGCVRLTNWDAARLAQMVSQSTEVIFEA